MFMSLLGVLGEPGILAIWNWFVGLFKVAFTRLKRNWVTGEGFHFLLPVSAYYYRCLTCTMLIFVMKLVIASDARQRNDITAKADDNRVFIVRRRCRDDSLMISRG